MIPSIIHNLPRTVIRYILFNYRDNALYGNEIFVDTVDFPYKWVDGRNKGEVIGILTKKQINSVVKYYEKQGVSVADFTPITDQEIDRHSWDIGIDDESTIHSRHEKYFLYGIPKHSHVMLEGRPELLPTPDGQVSVREKLCYTLAFIDLAKFVPKSKRQNKAISESRVFAEKILEATDSRENWNKEFEKIYKIAKDNGTNN